MLAALLLLTTATPMSAQTSDGKPPSLEAFSINPTTVDVSGGPQTINFAARITDDLSGASSVLITFRSPTTGQFLQQFIPRVSGNGLDGMWAGSLVLPQFSEGGIWTVTSVQVFDLAGNTSSISTSVMVSRGFPTQVLVVSNPDTHLPTLTGVAVSPSNLDVSSSDQTVTVDIQATDDISGVAFSPCTQSQNFNFFAVILRSPSGAQNRYMAPFPFALVAGNRLSGTWRGSFTMPRYSEAGKWVISSITFHDCAGNTRFVTETQLGTAGLQVALNVGASQSDLQGPTLTSLNFLPITVNTSTGNQPVKVRFGITDNLAGTQFSPTTSQLSFGESGIEFRSPSGAQVQAAWAFTPFTLVSGTPLNGVWESTITFPRFSEEGTWTVDFFTIKDRTRNLTNFTAAGLSAAGFPSTIEVIKPSLIPDGTIGSGGGQVSDQTFGDRATVFFPPGALSTSTQVAIDVLAKPLDLPNPTGFTGPGTLFVNIHLTPEPNFPLAAPGLTLVLPLTNPMVSGTQMKLYRVDPATGQLVPAISVFGKEVVGFVDADGLSATFQGISRLSTVVGLIPEALNVGVDIKPGDSPNTINLKSKGVLPVAILSTDTFDATTVSPETVRLAGASVRLKGNGQPAFSFEDVNGDGRLDIVLQFDTQSLEITSTDTQANLTGRTKDGLRIVGHDDLRIVPN
jgi:hypothetical protein